MTKNEVIKILAVCKGAGVQFGDCDRKVLVEIWTRCFANNSYQDVSRALIELINTRKSLFLNGLIGELKDQLAADKINFLDFAMVWTMIRTAAHRTHPDVPEQTELAFASLPPMVQYLVGSSRHLEEMEYCIDRDTLETVEKSNMRKMYTELVTAAKNQVMLGKEPVWQRLERNCGHIDLQISKLLQGHTV